MTEMQKDDTDAATLHSGMLLNHCILYRDFSFLAKEFVPFIMTDEMSSQRCCIYLYMKENSIIEEIITYDKVHALFDKIKDSTDFRWIHILDKSLIPLIIEKFSLHYLVYKAFDDSLPRTTINFMEDGCCSNFTTFCKITDQNSIKTIATIKTYIYIHKLFAITMERRSYASDKTSDENSITGSKASPHKNLSVHIIEDERVSMTLEDQKGTKNLPALV